MIVDRNKPAIRTNTFRQEPWLVPNDAIVQFAAAHRRHISGVSFLIIVILESPINGVLMADILDDRFEEPFRDSGAR